MAVTLFACLLFLGQSCGVFLVALSVDRGWLVPVFTGAAVGVLVLGGVIGRSLRAGRLQAQGAQGAQVNGATASAASAQAK
jgi:hypothetical protein